MSDLTTGTLITNYLADTKAASRCRVEAALQPTAARSGLVKAADYYDARASAWLDELRLRRADKDLDQLVKAPGK
ncbi:hypothetical protein [Caulobacter sp. NIBR2454]|uniref:hypothetical protein n=1 Tax=Caulobacter sp. NIBR2454 TaxID=3015996 RepID=UPI0022B61BE2|nr:hypothetical protein [Caulobacter sp. NIBR2454]